MKSMLYAGVGSRATPEPVLDLMRRCATRLEVLGYTLRSGGANGADTAFEEGCCRKELYLPGLASTDGNRSFRPFATRRSPSRQAASSMGAAEQPRPETHGTKLLSNFGNGPCQPRRLRFVLDAGWRRG